jgi:LysR family transcriptional regulator, glycine cleavage system transcriptional activator
MRELFSRNLEDKMARRLPPLHALPDFEAAARHLSFTKAAVELHVTHGAVSRQVKSLENYLGLSLFRRLNRALRLTDEGQTYARSVHEILDSLAEATQRLRTSRDASGLTVSTTYSFTSGWLVPRLGRFRALNPEIDVRLQANDEVIDFARDNVDLAIRYGRGQYPGLAAERLMGDDYAPVASPALLKGRYPLKKPADLRHHVLLHEEGTEVDWRMWLAAAGVEGVDASRGPIFSHLTMAIQAAIRGEGVALGRTAIVEEELAAGQLVRLFGLRLKAEMAYYIVCPSRALERPKVRAFRDWLLAEARSITR